MQISTSLNKQKCFPCCGFYDPELNKGVLGVFTAVYDLRITKKFFVWIKTFDGDL